MFKALLDKNNPRNSLLLKLRALGISILSILLRHEIKFTFPSNNNDSIDLKQAEEYFDLINDKMIRLLNTQWIK